MFYTYSSHPTACAIADRVLEIMEREHLVERAAEMGARLGAQLKEELSGHPMVGDIRGTGMFWGVEMVRDRASRDAVSGRDGVASRVVAAAAQARAVRLSGDRDGAAGRRRGDGHAAVRDRRGRNRIHREHLRTTLDEAFDDVAQSRCSRMQPPHRPLLPASGVS